ncbi:MAG: hypothetical protein E4H14_01165 [Candidatus Thorarchaeota archaeon]|nr:MAG: hypothetical protein E4H14_01165 [Candidatus Thorarchaeota archaeon]
MDEEQPVIKINPSKTTDLDFEVSVTTNCADDKPCVRFGIELEEEKRWLSLVCFKDEESRRWSVSIPPLKPIVDRPEYPFILEVILEDYYFVPAKGVLRPVSTPSVDMGGQKKPKITATFGVSEPAKEKDEKEEKIEETGRAPGTGTAHGDYKLPVVNKPRPEFPPKETHVEEPEKEELDVGDLGSSVTPGDQGMTTDTRKQPDGKGPFDAREIAAQIIKDRSKAKKPDGKGFLFRRVGEQAVVEGLESKAVKKVLEERAQKVKNILKD